MRPTTSYLICSMPRCGGGLLGGMLRSSGVAGRPEEYFWRDDIPHWRDRWGTAGNLEYLHGALREGTTPNGIFGARVMWSYLDEVVAMVNGATRAEGARHAVLASAFPGLRYVHLTRRDHLTQAVSWPRPNSPVPGTQGTNAFHKRHLRTTAA